VATLLESADDAKSVWFKFSTSGNGDATLLMPQINRMVSHENGSAILEATLCLPLSAANWNKCWSAPCRAVLWEDQLVDRPMAGGGLTAGGELTGPVKAIPLKCT